jgi:hypothetical protein
MADFLTRLVGRTLGTTPTVQPVLTPMFALEPVGVGLAPTLYPAPPHPTAALPLRDTSRVPSTSETLTEQAQDATPTKDQPVLQTQPHTDLSMPFVPQQYHIDTELTPPTPTKSHTVGTGQAQGKGTVGTGLAPVREELAHADQTGHNVPPTGFRTGASPIPTIRPDRAVRYPAHPSGQAPTLSPVPTTGMPVPEISDAPDTRQRRGRAGPDPAGNLRTADHLRSPYSYSDQRGRATTDHFESVPPTSEPTIQVTIGRIEVRATPPAPSVAPAQQRKLHVMGLEEYLDQRARGGR